MTGTISTAIPAGNDAAARRAAGFAQGLLALNCTMIFVAMPEITDQLALSRAEAVWLPAGYWLGMAAFLLTGRVLCARAGGRTVFTAAMVLFLLASLTGVVIPPGGGLCGARVVQGMAAALMQAALPVLIRGRFQADYRQTAQSFRTAAGGAGLVAGVLAGGLFSHLCWPLVFLINLPAGLIILWQVRHHFPAVAAQESDSVLSVGALSAALAAGSLIQALMSYLHSGHPVFIADRLAAVLSLLFLLHEKWSPRPLFPQQLRQQRAFLTGCLASVFYMASAGGQLFLMTLFWQQSQGFSALHTGLLLTPLLLLLAAGSLLTRTLRHRPGSGTVLTAGFIISAAGLFLTGYGVSGSLSALFICGILLSGIGHGMIRPAVMDIGLIGIPAAQQTQARDIMSTCQYLSGALTLALLNLMLKGGRIPDDWQQAFCMTGYMALAGAMVVFCRAEK